MPREFSFSNNNDAENASYYLFHSIYNSHYMYDVNEMALQPSQDFTNIIYPHGSVQATKRQNI